MTDDVFAAQSWIGPLLHVRCNSCGNVALTANGSDLDGTVKCSCCPLDHSHAGDECDRTVTITATAYLSGSVQ